MDFTKSTLNYPLGAPTPIRREAFPRAPTTSDFRNWTPGDEWWDTVGQDWWKFVERSGSPPTALWVKIGGTAAAAESFNVDAATPPGTDPVIPTALNEITITGAQVASGVIGANVIRTDSLAASTITIEIQRSADAAAPDSTLNGVSHFDSAAFQVDADGFVQLVGGGTSTESFIPDTGTSPVIPSATGQVSIIGQGTPNISGIRVTGGTNVLNLSMFSPFEGDFSFTQSNASSATNRKIAITNADTTDPASNAQIIASVGGTSSGDAHLGLAVASSRAYAFGPDTSDSSILKLTTAAAGSVTPSTGNEIIKINPNPPAGPGSDYIFAEFISIDPNSNLSIFNITAPNDGPLELQVINTGTSSNSNSSLDIRCTGGAGAGSPYIDWVNNINPSDIYLGLPPSSTNLQITVGGIPGAGGNTLFEITRGGNITLGFDTSSQHTLNTTTSGTGTAGSGAATPATVEGFIAIIINGTERRIPFYPT